MEGTDADHSSGDLSRYLYLDQADVYKADVYIHTQ